MKFLMMAFALFGVSRTLVATAQSLERPAYKIFEEEVWPTLTKRCSECHAFEQSPYHSSFELKESYLEAKKVIVLESPENSPLWFRSFNMHCGKPNLCGEMDQVFLDSLRAWINQEKTEALDLDSNLVKAGEIKIKVEDLLRQKSISIPGGVYFAEMELQIEDLGSGVVLLKDALLRGLSTSLNIDGLEIRVDRLVVRRQNLSEKAWVFKEQRDSFVRLIEKGDTTSGSYLMLEGLDKLKESEEITFSLWLKNPKTGMSLEEQNQLFTRGLYMASYDQKISEDVGGIFSIYKYMPLIGESRGNLCAWFASGAVKCWGGGVGTHPGEMTHLNHEFDFSEYGGLEKVFDVGGWFESKCFLTKVGRLFCLRRGDLGFIELNFTGTPIEVGTFADLLFITYKSDKGIKTDIYDNRSGQQLALQTGNKSGIKGLYHYENVTNYLQTQVVESVLVHFFDGSVKFVPLDEFEESLEKRNGSYLKSKKYADLGYKGKVSDVYAFENGFLTSSGLLLFLDHNKIKLVMGQPYGKPLQELREASIFYFKTDAKIQKFQTNGEHWCFLFDTGRVKCTHKDLLDNNGDFNESNFFKNFYFPATNEYMNFGIDDPVIDIVSGIGSSGNFCALFKNGKMRCWGEYVDRSNYYAPKPLWKNYPETIAPEDSRGDLDLGRQPVRKLYSKNLSAQCGLFMNGNLKCWGYNDKGLLGIETNKNHHPGLPESMGEHLPFNKVNEAHLFLK